VGWSRTFLLFSGFPFTVCVPKRTLSGMINDCNYFLLPCICSEELSICWMIKDFLTIWRLSLHYICTEENSVSGAIKQYNRSLFRVFLLFGPFRCTVCVLKRTVLVSIFYPALLFLTAVAKRVSFPSSILRSIDRWEDILEG
jgi:hypothetical protein